ncbi:hypothetical protein DOTSEDRAFT_75697 [Dothistroma septosporum NZE10]|uniref:Uncharacterized protein n=1 Tax=Dothistroma septosporum (strain NZE10 / CBS 128990) TaxID=675120 RepID=N1PBV7_DOTSN|nr:hypothetical protein DOTSEDRAFT_75697 [Dothistroma septosporum NZE10]
MSRTDAASSKAHFKRPKKGPRGHSRHGLCDPPAARASCLLTTMQFTNTEKRPLTAMNFAWVSRGCLRLWSVRPPHQPHVPNDGTDSTTQSVGINHSLYRSPVGWWPSSDRTIHMHYLIPPLVSVPLSYAVDSMTGIPANTTE